MKKAILLFLGTFFILTAKAQTIGIQGTAGVKSDTVAKNIVDYAQYRVIYEYSRQSDPESEFRSEGFGLLQIGPNHCKYMDYAAYRSDSLLDDTVKQGKNSMEALPGMMALGREIILNASITTNRKYSTLTTQWKIGLAPRQQYSEPIPSFDWQLAEGDTIIAGYHCQKALTTFRGRDYVAWYAPEIQLPYGPFKFSGLPGLIFCIYDTKRHHQFTIAGLETVHFVDPIYLSTKNIEESTRDTARIMYRNYCADPAKALLNSGKTIKMSDEVIASIEPKPYNPIELE